MLSSVEKDMENLLGHEIHNLSTFYLSLCLVLIFFLTHLLYSILHLNPF